MGDFQTIDGRAFVGNTPVVRAMVGDTIQWDVMAIGSEHHTFHVHGHRWRDRAGVPEDTRTLGPGGELPGVAGARTPPAPGCTTATWSSTWSKGMIGIYRVSR